MTSADLPMITASFASDLLGQYVLLDHEQIRDATENGDEVVVVTSLQRFRVRSERTAWAVGHAHDIDDVVVATRTDQGIHGTPQRFVFVRFGAETVFANDADQLADLGRRLRSDLDPAAFAELLVQLHPYSSARRELLVTGDDLATLFATDELPEVEPLTVHQDRDEFVLTFSSATVYRPPGSVPLLDLFGWTVTVLGNDPAVWDVELLDEGIPI